MRAKIINKKVMVTNATVRCGDKNADKITFELPVYYGDISLENMPVYIKTLNRLDGKGKTLLQSTKSGDNLLIEWLIGEEATAVNGLLSCQLSFESDDGEIVLNTNVFEILIENSIKDGLPKVSAEYNHIVQMQNELQRALKEDVLRKQDDISLLNNDANYTTVEEISEEFATKDYVDQLPLNLFFEDYSTFLESINSKEVQPKYNSTVRIKSGEVCDLCVSAVSEEFVTCSYTEEQFIEQIQLSGSVQVGYCVYHPFKALSYSDPLPEVDQGDAGKYLTVDDNGEWQASELFEYTGESEDGTVVETIKGVDVEEVYSGESAEDGDYTVTPITFLKSDGFEHEVQVKAKNGVNILSVESGEVADEEGYTITPVTVTKSDGSSEVVQIKAKNGVNISSVEGGEATDAEGYTITPIIFTKSDGSKEQLQVKAKFGSDGVGVMSLEILNGELIVYYTNGAYVNLGAIAGVASSSSYGMIKADSVKTIDTSPVRIADDGKLYTIPAILYDHTITVISGESKCMFRIIKGDNSSVTDMTSFIAMTTTGYYTATGIVNGVAVMAIRRSNLALYMTDINGTESYFDFSACTFSDVVRQIKGEVVT